MATVIAIANQKGGIENNNGMHTGIYAWLCREKSIIDWCWYAM